MRWRCKPTSCSFSLCVCLAMAHDMFAHLIQCTTIIWLLLHLWGWLLSNAGCGQRLATPYKRVDKPTYRAYASFHSCSRRSLASSTAVWEMKRAAILPVARADPDVSMFSMVAESGRRPDGERDDNSDEKTQPCLKAFHPRALKHTRWPVAKRRGGIKGSVPADCARPPRQ